MSEVTNTASDAVEVLEPQAQEAAEVVAEVEAADAVAEAVIEKSTFGDEAAEAVLEAGEAAEAVVEDVAAAVAPQSEESAVVSPTNEEPVAEEPVAEEPVAEEPVAVASVAAEAVAEETVAEVAAAETPLAKTPLAETSVVETPVAEEPAAEESVAETPVAENEVAEDPAAEAGEASESTDASGKRVVRTLAVGQEVTGTVKRISEFGAFVDIGVGRDGLVHISELSVKRVGKVTDVLKEGEQVQLWIKKLDRERNRISLTLIPPGTVTIRDLNKDDIVNGVVTRILPYGAFVDIGVGRDALLHVREMGERYIAKPEEVVKVGEEIEARIIEIQRRRGRIDLSIKGLRPEPEVEAAAPASTDEKVAEASNAAAPAASPEAEYVDPFAEMEVLSPFQVALMRAQERSGVELDYEPSGKKGKQRKDRQRREQEEIFERTLKGR